MPRGARQLVEPIATTLDTLTAAVFVGQRTAFALSWVRSQCFKQRGTGGAPLFSATKFTGSLMACIQNATPKSPSGSYRRLFDNAALGELASKVQSAVITSGKELEKTIAELVPNILDPDEFLGQGIMRDGLLLACKRQIRQSRTLESAGPEPDFMVFKCRGGIPTCHIVELKDGHVFDTKKAETEHQAMQGFIKRNAQRIQYPLRAHFCAFNQDDRRAIWEGFKRRINFNEAMTGREFCDLVEIDHDEILERRRKDGNDNVEFFIQELLRIEPVRQRLLQLLHDGKKRT